MSVQSDVTDKIISVLEAGSIPWVKPWKSAAPSNIFSKKPYRGINILLLSMASIENEWSDSRYATFKQINDHDGRVRKGEKATAIIFAKPVRVKFDPLRHTGKPNPDGTICFPIWKKYFVFNVSSQTVGLDKFIDTAEFIESPSAKSVVDNMPLRPAIRFGGDMAFYSPLDDSVQLPDKALFSNNNAFYQTEFHELAHSTGHPSRLNRFAIDTDLNFGSADYSREELVAEISSCFLMSHCGLEINIENSAAYIKSWLSAIQGDRSMVLSAAGKSQHVMDFILGQKASDSDSE